MQNPQCHDVNGHGIQGSILITDGPHGKLEPHVSQEACMDVIKQVCPYTHLSNILILWIGTNKMPCIRSRTSVHTVVLLAGLCPTLTTTEVIGSGPMWSSIPTTTAARSRTEVAGRQGGGWFCNFGRSSRTVESLARQAWIHPQSQWVPPSYPCSLAAMSLNPISLSACNRAKVRHLRYSPDPMLIRER